MPLPIADVDRSQLKSLWEQTTIPVVAPFPRAAVDALPSSLWDFHQWNVSRRLLCPECQQYTEQYYSLQEWQRFDLYCDEWFEGAESYIGWSSADCQSYQGCRPCVERHLTPTMTLVTHWRDLPRIAPVILG